MSDRHDPQRRLCLQATLAGAAWLAWRGARAAPVSASDRLRAFVTGVSAGRARFEQTVTAADGGSRKTSSGRFEFARPGRFRFDYEKPYPQTIVSDGRRVWMHDPDLNQVTVRPYDVALGASPAALLAGASIERDFALREEPARDGLAWVRATPKAPDAAFQWMAVGFADTHPARVEILDRFGQQTVLRLLDFEVLASVAPERFDFQPPPGADVVEQ